MAPTAARCRALLVLLDGWSDLHLTAAQRTVFATGASGGVIACLQDGRLLVAAAEGVTTAVGSDVSLVDTMLGHVIQSDEKPSVEHVGNPGTLPRHAGTRTGWSRLAAAPLRLNGQVVGGLGLRLDVDDWPTDSPIAQLEYALVGRVAIELAKGLLAGRHGLRMPEAFETMRRYARHHQRRLRDVADDIVEGHLDPMTVTDVDHDWR